MELASQKPSRAQPAAQYIPSPGVPICAAALVSNVDTTDENLLIPDRIIMWPDFCCLICGRHALMILSGPK